MAFNINLNNALSQYENIIDFAAQEAVDLGITEFKDFIVDKKGGEFNLPVFAPLVFEPLIKDSIVLPLMRLDAVNVAISRSKKIVKTALFFSEKKKKKKRENASKSQTKPVEDHKLATATSGVALAS